MRVIDMKWLGIAILTMCFSGNAAGEEAAIPVKILDAYQLKDNEYNEALERQDTEKLDATGYIIKIALYSDKIFVDNVTKRKSDPVKYIVKSIKGKTAYVYTYNNTLKKGACAYMEIGEKQKPDSLKLLMADPETQPNFIENCKKIKK